MGYNVRIGKSEHASKRMQMLAAAAFAVGVKS